MSETTGFEDLSFRGRRVGGLFCLPGLFKRPGQAVGHLPFLSTQVLHEQHPGYEDGLRPSQGFRQGLGKEFWERGVSLPQERRRSILKRCFVLPVAVGRKEEGG